MARNRITVHSWGKGAGSRRTRTRETYFFVRNVVPSSAEEGWLCVKKMLLKATDYGADGVVISDEMFRKPFETRFED